MDDSINIEITTNKELTKKSLEMVLDVIRRDSDVTVKDAETAGIETIIVGLKILGWLRKGWNTVKMIYNTWKKVKGIFEDLENLKNEVDELKETVFNFELKWSAKTVSVSSNDSQEKIMNELGRLYGVTSEIEEKLTELIESG